MTIKEIPSKVKHFGVNLSERKYKLKLIREEYALINKTNTLSKFSGMEKAYEDKEGKTYTDRWCRKHQKQCLENYDLNMEFFSLLDHDEFNQEISGFLKKYPTFSQLHDLNEWKEKTGYYILILDEYCQVYIGTSKDISKRIRQHWSVRKSFDRLLMPMGAVETSVMSIDSFRALDTTRILAYETPDLFHTEDEFINFFSSHFVTNRTIGGLISGELKGAMEVIKGRKSKELK